MATKNYSILTNRGKALEAASAAGGDPVVLKKFVVGDGNGQVVTPDAAQTALVREVYRGTISLLEVSPEQENQFIAYLSLPEGVGNFTVREAGLLTDNDELYAVGSCAAIEKPENGVTVTLQFRLAVSESAQITLQASTGDGLFLRQAANLSDVRDKPQAVEHLGLKPTVDKANNAVQRDGDTMTGKLILPQTSAFGVNTDNAIGGNSIAIGDNDTGLKQQGDGILDVFANSAHVFRFINGNNESLRSLVVYGNCHATGEVLSGNGAAKIATDGNIYGPVWGGWLSAYLQGRTGVQDIRLGAVVWVGPSANGSNASLTAPDGHVLTAILDGDTVRWPMPDSPDAAYARPIQKLVNGTWYNVGSV
ncbi:phage tail protein [Citrobacter sp. S-77]|uniref:phage tail protein n=1 Tax=Citrobacter sp. S-77 TaxID=1080067 RepID=UPI00069411DD|nr:phage tail protein [Citrobacter sp. S-77]